MRGYEYRPLRVKFAEHLRLRIPMRGYEEWRRGLRDDFKDMLRIPMRGYEQKYIQSSLGLFKLRIPMRGYEVFSALSFLIAYISYESPWGVMRLGAQFAGLRKEGYESPWGVMSQSQTGCLPILFLLRIPMRGYENWDLVRHTISSWVTNPHEGLWGLRLPCKACLIFVTNPHEGLWDVEPTDNVLWIIVTNPHEGLWEAICNCMESEQKRLRIPMRGYESSPYYICS